MPLIEDRSRPSSMAVASRCTRGGSPRRWPDRPDRGGTGHRRYRPVGAALGHQRLHQLGPRREALGPYLANRRAGDRLDHQRPGRAGVGGQQRWGRGNQMAQQGVLPSVDTAER